MHRTSSKYLNVTTTLVVLFAGLLMLNGCSPSNEPKVVPASSGPQKKFSSTQPVPRNQIAINSSIAGYNMLCVDYAGSSVFWLKYGKKGAVERQKFNTPHENGMRYEIGTYLNKTDRTVFQFDRSGKPVAYRSIQSGGGSSEMFSNEEMKPVMNCFKSFNSSFIWMDSTLLSEAQALIGSWSCTGPMDRTLVKGKGLIATAKGNGQALLWLREKSVFLTVFFKGAPSANGQVEYEKFSEMEVQLSDIQAGKWSYKVAGQGEVAENGSCTRVMN